jgi:long-chain acyl-CoA synthetase
VVKELSYQEYDDSWGAEPIPPTPEESLLHMLGSSVQNNPDKAASILFHRATTYREIDRLSDRLAMFLVEAGIKKGDRVATMLPNSTQHLIAFFGILKAGAIVVPFNIMLQSESER